MTVCDGWGADIVHIYSIIVKCMIAFSGSMRLGIYVNLLVYANDSICPAAE